MIPFPLCYDVVANYSSYRIRTFGCRCDSTTDQTADVHGLNAPFHFGWFMRSWPSTHAYQIYSLAPLIASQRWRQSCIFATADSLKSLLFHCCILEQGLYSNFTCVWGGSMLVVPLYDTGNQACGGVSHVFGVVLCWLYHCTTQGTRPVGEFHVSSGWFNPTQPP